MFCVVAMMPKDPNVDLLLCYIKLGSVHLINFQTLKLFNGTNTFYTVFFILSCNCIIFTHMIIYCRDSRILYLFSFLSRIMNGCSWPERNCQLHFAIETLLSSMSVCYLEKKSL